MASYPSSVKSFGAKSTGDVIQAQHVNDLQDEVAAIETDLLDGNVFATKIATGINASALSTGTVPLARLDSNVILTTSSTGINASALSTGTIPNARISGDYTSITSLSLGANVIANVTTVFVGNSSVNTAITAGEITLSGVTVGTNASTLSAGTLPIARLDANVILTTSTTGINASALSTGTIPLARLDSNVILTTSTTGINASALSTGTMPLARLDANVILTTSTTGINASALSTGTVPLARLTSANTTANGVVDTTTQSFAGNKTFTNNVEVSGALSLGANVTANTSTVFVGNSTSNVVISSGSITVNGTALIPVSLDPVVAAIALG